jgi:adiponectin receptor
VLIGGSALPIMYYSFACEAELINRWVWTSFFLFICACAFGSSMSKAFDEPKYRPVRGAMFIFSSCAIIAVFVNLLAFKNENKVPLSIWGYIIGGISYIGGTCIYIARVPERCKPGMFDFCGASH